MTPHDSDQGWSERHAEVVRSAAPQVPMFTAAERDALWRRIDTATPRTPTRRRRWRKVMAGVVAVGAIGGVGVAGTAAGDVFSAHTGTGPSDAEDSELGGPGERLDPLAPDFASVVGEVTSDIRFPSAEARATALAWQVESHSSNDPVEVSTGTLRLWTAGHALCAWSNVWAVALRSGDATTQQQAADVILSAREWPSITDSDPDMAHESEFAWLPDLERAIRAEDPAAARRPLARNSSCMPGLAPALGLGKRW